MHAQSYIHSTGPFTGRGGTRTRTEVALHWILSPERLPIPPLGRSCHCCKFFGNSKQFTFWAIVHRPLEGSGVTDSVIHRSLIRAPDRRVPTLRVKALLDNRTSERSHLPNPFVQRFGSDEPTKARPLRRVLPERLL